MKPLNFLLILMLGCMMTSCYTTFSVSKTVTPAHYATNDFDHLVGKTKPEILSIMSVPDRIIEDGLGGEILIYEKKEQVTRTSGTQTSKSNTNVTHTPHTGVDGDNYVKSHGSTTTTNNINSTSVTTEYKDYVNAFIGTDGVCYKVDSQIWHPEVTKQDCYKELKSSVLWWLVPPVTPIGIITSIWLIIDRAIGPRPVDCK